MTVNYRGLDVYTCEPWGQGPVFPQALSTLQGFDLGSMGHNSDEYIHTVTQALNLSFADMERYVGDPDFVDVPMDELLSEAYLQQRRALIDPARAWPEMPPPGDPQSPWEAVAAAGKEGKAPPTLPSWMGRGTCSPALPVRAPETAGP